VRQRIDMTVALLHYHSIGGNGSIDDAQSVKRGMLHVSPAIRDDNDRQIVFVMGQGLGGTGI
jgi:hypothetical protein